MPALLKGWKALKEGVREAAEIREHGPLRWSVRVDAGIRQSGVLFSIDFYGHLRLPVWVLSVLPCILLISLVPPVISAALAVRLAYRTVPPTIERTLPVAATCAQRGWSNFGLLRDSDIVWQNPFISDFAWVPYNFHR